MPQLIVCKLITIYVGPYSSVLCTHSVCSMCSYLCANFYLRPMGNYKIIWLFGIKALSMRFKWYSDGKTIDNIFVVFVVLRPFVFWNLHYMCVSVPVSMSFCFYRFSAFKINVIYNLLFKKYTIFRCFFFWQII